MQYLILIYDDEQARIARRGEDVDRMLGDYWAYTTAINDEGVNLGGNALQPAATAKQIRVGDDGMTITDGPFAETREQLGGYYLIDVASEEQAIDVAARCPGARHGRVELRPVMVFATDG